MTFCRTCLTTPAEKDILALEKDINECNRNYFDIMLFCLDIKVIRNSPVTTNLCHNCYGKIISFYKFKEQCLKNDAYLKSLGSESSDHDIKNENCVDSDAFNSKFDEVTIDLKNELDVKQEDTLDLQSDDELLSVTQKVKHEFVAEESKENANVPKKRGCAKKPKLVSKNVKNNARQVCEECGKSVRNLSEHSLCHRPKSERRRVQCMLCPKSFTSHGSYYRHNRVKHLGLKEQCDICKKEVVSLWMHKLHVHNQAVPPHECDQCDKKFRCKSNLDQHRRRMHDNEKMHLCQFCSKSFFAKIHLQEHIRSHTKEKPYECNTCGKFFSRTCNLKEHRLIHSDEKPFCCDVCSKTFTRSQYLKAHMISHTSERRHPCKYCGRRFIYSNHRKRHELNAHEKHITTT